MDLRSDSYYAQLKLSGVAEPIGLSGSIMSITGAALQHLTQLSPRKVNSAKTITLMISDSPITSQALADNSLMNEVISGIDSKLATREVPLDSEDAMAFVSRLTDMGYPIETSMMLAADAFEYDPLSQSAWITDPQAIKLRQMHASQFAYDNADPAELAYTLSHCRTHYPEQMASMRFRG
jgi:hypothetical protein